MSKLIRFDEQTFGYLTEKALSHEAVETLMRVFPEAWPGKRLLVIQEIDEFIDLTGQYEIVPIAETVTTGGDE